jgi:hypothetical protein
MSDARYGDTLEIECRIAYPQLGLTDAEIAKKASKKKGKAAKFKDKKNNITCLIKKSDKKTLKAIEDACTEVAEVESVDELTKWPLADDKGNMRDGDDEENAEKEGFAGCYYFKTGTDQSIDFYMLDEDGEPVEVPDADVKKIFYPGANCLVVLTVCEWEEGSVTFYLKGIMRLDAEGKRLGDTFDSSAIFKKYAGKGGTKKTVEVKKKKAPVEEVEDDEDEEEEEVVVVKKKKAKAPVEEVEEDEEEEEVVVKKKKAKAPVEEDEEDEEEEEKPAKKKEKKKSSLSAILD